MLLRSWPFFLDCLLKYELQDKTAFQIYEPFSGSGQAFMWTAFACLPWPGFPDITPPPPIHMHAFMQKTKIVLHTVMFLKSFSCFTDPLSEQHCSTLKPYSQCVTKL